MLVRYVPIAIPDLREWYPISSTSKPRLLVSNTAVTILSFGLICDDDMYDNLPLDDLHELIIVELQLDG